jgi:Flp pilus assembly protein TadD
LGDKKLRGQAETFLRTAQRRHPNDFWLNHTLMLYFRGLPPPRRQEAIRFAALAVGLRPASPGAHVNLGGALQDNGKVDEAIAEYREALRLMDDYREVHYLLGNLLRKKGRLEEAVRELRAAIRLKEDDPIAHNTLGAALWAQRRWDEAIAECKEALRLKDDYPEAYNNLGIVLTSKGRLEEAIKAYRQALHLRKDFAEVHCNLGATLYYNGQLKEAIDEFRKALRLNKDLGAVHNNLGEALATDGQLDQALAEYQTAVRLMKDNPQFRCDLGDALFTKGLLDEAIEAYQEAVRLKKDFPNARNKLALARQCKEAAARLPRILKGEAQPADAADCIVLGRLCAQQARGLYAAAARFYAQAFADKPQLADYPTSQNRYDAACAAARAGCGQGRDAGGLDAAARARLRRQALDWLRADLEARRRLLDKGPARQRPAIAQQLAHWLGNRDLAGVRGDQALAGLPQAEGGDWRTLWQEVEALRRRAAAPRPRPPAPGPDAIIRTGQEGGR